MEKSPPKMNFHVISFIQRRNMAKEMPPSSVVSSIIRLAPIAAGFFPSSVLLVVVVAVVVVAVAVVVIADAERLREDRWLRCEKLL